MRILTAIVICAGIVGPFSMATAFAQTPADQSASQTSGIITGSIKDANGAPVSGASVTVTGPQTETTTSDAQGNFSIPNLKPGIYAFRATKTGYNAASETNVAVIPGATQTLAVTMAAVSFTSLRTIASVRSVGRGTFNTTPASVSVISSQTFQDQAQPQVMKVLNQTPGIVASYPGTGGNGAVPGAITFPNIRGALSFETASLVDGHPVSVGTFGDYVTSFLNPYMLQSVELVKGPGADAPEVNYAIGGTVNFITKEPSYLPSGMIQTGFDNHGSAIINFGISDTSGRFSWVAAYSNANLESGTSGARVFVSPQSPQQGVFNYNGATGTAAGFNDVFPTPIVPGTISTVENSWNLVACCQVVNSLFQNISELTKVRYKLSPVTSATFTYLGSQTTANQAANTGDITHAMFSMSAAQAAGYTGSLPNNSPLDIGFVRTPETEINNEPILQGDIRTSLGNDTILARYYAAGIDRLIFQGSPNPRIPTVLDMQLFGYDTATRQNYNGQTVPVAFFDHFTQTEIDKLKGYSFQWNHPFAEGNDLLTFGYDQTNSTTTSYSERTSGPRAGRAFNVAAIRTFQVVNVPQGSGQNFGTAMLRLTHHFNPKLMTTFTNYLNWYQNTFPNFCSLPSGNCAFNDPAWVFTTTHSSHYDPRLAFEYRPNSSTAVRFAMGSAIAPPYLGILSAVSQPISFSPPAPFATQQVSPTNLQPETAFGYDLGADYRFHDGVTFIGADIYLENEFNHFLNRSINGGICPAIDPVTGAPTNCPPNTPLFLTTWTNIANSRFQGVELSVKRVPAQGIGFLAQGALQKGYAYNLPPFFYCSVPGPGCKQDSTLAVIPGQNFNSGGIGGAVNADNLSNQSIPYSQAYGEVNFRSHGWYANVNLTYLGNNNALNVPGFTTLGATLRVPLQTGLSLQVSGDNLTNKYSSIWPAFGSGVHIPLANGQFAATQANVLGPSTIRFVLTKSFGEGTTGIP